MKIEQAKELAEKALAQLALTLEQGHSDELKKYLAAMAKFPRYSLHNLLLILGQRPDTARVAGYQTWRELGRQVNRGARGILTFAPIVRRKAEDNGREEVSGDNGSFVKLLGFRGVHVFAEEDTSGQPIPGLSRCSGDPSAFAERLRQFVTSRGIQLEYSENIRPAQGQCSAGKIKLLPTMRTHRPWRSLTKSWRAGTGRARIQSANGWQLITIWQTPVRQSRRVFAKSWVLSAM